METLLKSRAVVVVVLVHRLDLYKMCVLYSATGCSCSRSKSQLVYLCDAADYSENAENYCLKSVAVLNAEIVGNHVELNHKKEQKQKHFQVSRLLLDWLPMIYLLELDLDSNSAVAGLLKEDEQLLERETVSSAGMDTLTEATSPAHEAGAAGPVRDEGVERRHASYPELRSKREDPLDLWGPRSKSKLHDLAIRDILPCKEVKLQTDPSLCVETTWKRDVSGGCGCWEPLTPHTHTLIHPSLSGSGNIDNYCGQPVLATSHPKALASVIILSPGDHMGRCLVGNTKDTGTELPPLLQGEIEIVLRKTHCEKTRQRSWTPNTSFSTSASVASLLMSASKNLKTHGTQDRRDLMMKETMQSKNPSSMSIESSAPAREPLPGLEAMTNRFQSDQESRNLSLPHVSWHLALLSRGAAGSCVDINLITLGQLGTDAAPTPPGQYGICHDEIPTNTKRVDLSQWGELQLPTATDQSDIIGAKSIRALIEENRAPSSRGILAS